LVALLTLSGDACGGAVGGAARWPSMMMMISVVLLLLYG